MRQGKAMWGTAVRRRLLHLFARDIRGDAAPVQVSDAALQRGSLHPHDLFLRALGRAAAPVARGLSVRLSVYLERSQ
jgi:hypothetical protein